MKLIVGLGNPGKKYEKTRHNAGFRALRAFHTLHAEEFGNWTNKFSGKISEGRIGEEKIVLLQPEMFMNASGNAVLEAVQLWHLTPADIIIVFDDIAIPLGSIRLRRDGSAGGHNGMKSIIERLSTELFPRLRIGVGSERAAQIPMDKFVLEPFSAEEEVLLKDSLAKSVEALDVYLKDGIEAAMQKYN